MYIMYTASTVYINCIRNRKILCLPTPQQKTTWNSKNIPQKKHHLFRTKSQYLLKNRNIVYRMAAYQRDKTRDLSSCECERVLHD